jgi:putative inorganic carbon (HCO3(-)) transporter
MYGDFDNQRHALRPAQNSAAAGFSLPLVERLVLGFILLEFSLSIDKYFGWDDHVGLTGAISGYVVALSTLCLPLLYLVWIPRLLQQAMMPGHAGFRTNWLLILYLVFVGLSVFVAYDRQLVVYTWFVLAQAFLLFNYLANAVRTKADFFFVVAMLLGGVIIQSSLMILTTLVGDIQLWMLSSTLEPDSGRAAGTSGSPNMAAAYLGLLLPLAVGTLVADAGKWIKRIAFAALVTGGIALVLTQSRGGWIGLALSVGLLLLIGWRRSLVPLRVPVQVSVGAMVLAVCFSPLILSRLTADDQGAARSRIPLNQLTLKMIADHPLGVGVNNNAHVARIKYRGFGEFREEWFYTVHNKYLLICSEVGIFGLLAYLAFLISTIRIGWQASQRSERGIRLLTLAMMFGVAGQMVHMFVDIFNSRAQIQVLWALAALIIVAYHLRPADESLLEELGSAGEDEVPELVPA